MRFRFLPALILLTVALNGCGDNNKPATPNSNGSKSGETAADKDQDSAAKSEPVLSRGKPLKTAMQKAGYSPIFEPGLAQHVISHPMENNFDVYFKRVEKDKLHHIPAAGMKIWKPRGLEHAKFFSGFEKKGATLNVLTNPFSMAETTRNIIGDVVNGTREGVLFTKTIEVDGYEGIFYAGNEKIANNVLATYTIAFGSDNFSWIIKATFNQDEEMENGLGEQLLMCILNARVADEPRSPPGEDVDFIVSSDKLKVVDGFIDKLVLSRSGKFPVNDPIQPIFQISKGAVPERIDDRKEFASAFVSPSPLFKIDLLSAQNKLEIGGLEGYEFVSVGKDQVSQEPMQFYSAVLFDDDSMYAMHGWVSAMNTEANIDYFRSVAKSFRKRDVSQVRGGERSDNTPVIDEGENKESAVGAGSDGG